MRHYRSEGSMSKWFSGKEIIEKNGLDSLELFEYVSKGLLQPYHYQSYHSVPPPNIQQKKTKLEELKNELETLTNELAFCRSGSSSEDKQCQLEEKYFQGKIDFDTYVERSVAVWHDHTPEYVKYLEIEIKNKQKVGAVLEKNLSKVKNDSWSDFHLPYNEDQKKIINNDLLNSTFKLSEVEKITKLRKHDQRELDHMPTEKKQRPNQIAKTECRKIAKNLWNEDPSITIADMIVSDKISNECLAIAGNTFTENTLRDWIKDLCPNRLPGRRKKVPK
jgi:hypothetical protein